MAPNFNSPKQALEQGVCGQHGWSSRYFQDPDTSRWCVEVRWGVGSSQRQVFVSDDESDAASKPGIKKGHAAAATVALEGLTEILRAANVKPSRTIDETFGPRFDATCRSVVARWACCECGAPRLGGGACGVFCVLAVSGCINWCICAMLAQVRSPAIQVHMILD